MINIKNSFILLFVSMLCSCHQSKTLLQQDFGGQYELPSDFSKALEYIDSKLEGYDRRAAYQQLIIENPKSFFYDFNIFDDAPHYVTSPDGKMRIYSYNLGMHEDPPVLQFYSPKGVVITEHISAKPLFLISSGQKVSKQDYESGYYVVSTDVLGQLEINGTTTYIVQIFDYPDSSVDNELCGFVTGLQLSANGYCFVPIFESPSSGHIENIDENKYYVKRIRSVDDAPVQLQHTNGWYDSNNKALFIPCSVENTKEIFREQKWNDATQRFESVNTFGYNYPPDIHKSLGFTFGLEIVMYFGDLLIRVDDNDPYNVKYEHSYKYTAWGEGKTMADKPDIILYGGIKDEDNGTFHFVNKEYEYILPCAENKYNNTLVVKKNGSVVLHKEIKPDSER